MTLLIEVNSNHQVKFNQTAVTVGVMNSQSMVVRQMIYFAIRWQNSIPQNLDDYYLYAAFLQRFRDP